MYIIGIKLQSWSWENVVCDVDLAVVMLASGTDLEISTSGGNYLTILYFISLHCITPIQKSLQNFKIVNEVVPILHLGIKTAEHLVW